MKEKGMSTKVVKLKEYSSKDIGLFTQALLTVLLLIFSIIVLINKSFMPVFYSIIVMLMANLAYNNQMYFKKKYMTAIYIVAGVFVLIATILEYAF